MPRYPLLICAALVIATACSSDTTVPETTNEAPPLAASDGVRAAVHVTLAPTVGHSAAGMLMLAESSDGVTITGKLTGLPPDRELGFHVHTVGDCSAPDASSAGEHFDPAKQPHGDPRGDSHHLGDLPNVDVDDEGVADVDVTLRGVTLEGPEARSVNRRALVVHAQADDYETQPSGASGDRIACGVIAAAAS